MTDEKPKPFFDEEKKKRVIEWINQKCNGGNFTCECCGNKQWTLSEDLVTPVRFAGGVMLLTSGNTYPCVMAVCTTCANTKLFNVVMMGVLPKLEGEEKKEGENVKTPGIM